MRSPPPMSGAAIIEAIAASGVRTVASVPDRVTSEGVLRRLSNQQALRVVRVCKEDEGVSVCAALSYCHHRALMLMQHTGLLDSLNLLQWMVEYEMPIVMLVGLLGHESSAPPASSKKRVVRQIPGVLDALGITHEFLADSGDETRIAPAVERTYARSSPHAILIGRSPA